MGMGYNFSPLLQMFGSFCNKKLKIIKGTLGYNLYSFAQLLLPGRLEGLCPSGMEPTGKGCPSCRPHFFPYVQPKARRPQPPAPIHHPSTHIYCPPTRKPARWQAPEPSDQQDRHGACLHELTRYLGQADNKRKQTLEVMSD